MCSINAIIALLIACLAHVSAFYVELSNEELQCMQTCTFGTNIERDESLMELLQTIVKAAPVQETVDVGSFIVSVQPNMKYTSKQTNCGQMLQLCAIYSYQKLQPCFDNCVDKKAGARDHARLKSFCSVEDNEDFAECVAQKNKCSYPADTCHKFCYRHGGSWHEAAYTGYLIGDAEHTFRESYLEEACQYGLCQRKCVAEIKRQCPDKVQGEQEVWHNIIDRLQKIFEKKQFPKTLYPQSCKELAGGAAATTKRGYAFVPGVTFGITALIWFIYP